MADQAGIGSVSLIRGTSDEVVLQKRGYVLGKMLGEGSYAKVYLADFRDSKSGKVQRLACKVINGNSAPKDFLKKFFPREVEIMSRVTHPYLVRVHSILQRKNRYYLFMQYCENGDLLDFIRNNGAIDEKQSRQWYSQLVRGVKYLHDRDIVHRDLKCENVLLTISYNIKLTDFGFARYYHHGKDPKSETFCGSVSYAAPEIIRGAPYDPRLSDSWSLAVILFIMLNKGMPFDDSSLRKLYESQTHRSWKFRSKVKERLSPEIKDLMYRILEPDAEKRIPLENMFEEPWFQLGNAPSANNSRTSVYDVARTSVFLQSPSHHTYTMHDGVAIMDAETQQITYSRQIFPLPGIHGQGRPSVQQPPLDLKTRSDDEVPLAGTWSKSRRLNKDDDEDD